MKSIESWVCRDVSSAIQVRLVNYSRYSAKSSAMGFLEPNPAR